MPRPGRGGIHEGPAAPDDRCRGAAGAGSPRQASATTWPRLVLDVVLGYGAHDDPARSWRPRSPPSPRRDGPRVVVYVLGTDRDPQGLAGQRRGVPRRRLPRRADGGRAALAAAAIARRQPEIAEADAVVPGSGSSRTRPSPAVASCISWRSPRRLSRRAFPVEILALGDPRVGFFRPVDGPCCFVPPPSRHRSSRPEFSTPSTPSRRAWRNGGHRCRPCCTSRTASPPGPPCVSGTRAPASGSFGPCTTSTTSRRRRSIECQLRSIVDPDRVLIVSRTWQQRLADEYGVKADVVTNGVDAGRFRAEPAPAVVAELRSRRRCATTASSS